MEDTNKKTYSWETSRKSQRKRESLYIWIGLILIIPGLLFDCTNILLEYEKEHIVPNALKSIILVLAHFNIQIDDFSGFTQVIIQVLSAFGPLAIAILALVTGGISSEIYGISVSNYYLNIKPYYFKQKKIILGIIAATCGSVICYIFGLYNLVFSLFGITCLLIIKSILSLYCVFNGRTYIEEDIKGYLEYSLWSNNVSFSLQKDTLVAYTRWWIRQKQNNLEYERHKQIFINTIDRIIDKDSVEGIKVIEELSDDVITAFSHGNVDEKIRIYDYFEDVYSSILRYTSNNNCYINYSFGLFDSCYTILVEELYNIPYRKLKKVCDWRSLAYYISRVAIYCHFNEENNKNDESTNKALERIQKSVIWMIFAYVRVLAYHATNGEEVKKQDWGIYKGLTLFSDTGVPDECKDTYNKVLCNYKFAYFAALIKTCQGELALSYAEIIEQNPSYYGWIYSDILLITLLLGYVYYVGVKERVEYVSDEMKEIGNELIRLFKKRKIFDNLLIGMLDYKGSLSSLYKDFYEVLDRYEEVPSDGKAKICIMDNVVTEFFLALSVIYSGRYGMNNLLESFVKYNNTGVVYNAYTGSKSDDTINKIRNIYALFFPELDDCEKEIERGYSSFVVYSVKQHKNYELEQAKKEFEIFKTQNENNKLLYYYEKCIRERFDQLLQDWAIPPKERYSEERIIFWDRPISILCLTDDLISGNMKSFEMGLLSFIINRLTQLNRIKEYKNVDDRDFEAFLRNNDYNYAVGPQFAFAPFDYQKRNYIVELLQDKGCECINFGYGSTGLLLRKKIEFEVTDIRIKFRHLEYSDCSYRIEDDKYYYKESDGTELEFTKDEFETYMYNSHLILMITMKIKFGSGNEDIGYLIKKEHD